MCFPHGISAIDQENCFDPDPTLLSARSDLEEALLRQEDRKKRGESVDEALQSDYIKNLRERVKLLDEKQESVKKAMRFFVGELGISELHCNMDPNSWKPPFGQNRVEPTENVLRQTLEEKTATTETAQLALERLLNRVQTHACTINYCQKRIGVATVEDKEHAAELYWQATAAVLRLQ